MRETRTGDDGRQLAPARGAGPAGGGRRAQLLGIAINLFAQHGYEAVGVDDIGAVAGVSGPALYRHFRGKPDVLVAAYEHAWTRMQSELQQVLAAHAPPAETLAALVGSWVDIAVDDRALIAVYVREERGLPEADRRRLRRHQRSYIAEWAGQLGRLRPALDADEAEMLVRAAIAAINSVAFYELRSPDPRLREVLRDAAWAILTGGTRMPRPARGSQRVAQPESSSGA